MTTKEDSTQKTILKYLIYIVEFWYIIFFVLLIALIYYFVQNKYSYTVYTSNASVLIKKNNSNPELIAGGLMLAPQRNLENEIGVLKSFTLIERVINKLDFRVSYFKDNSFGYDPELYKDAPFIVEFDTTIAQINYVPIKIKIINNEKYQINIEDFDLTKTLLFGEKFEYKNFSFVIKKRDSIFYAAHYGQKYFFYFNKISNLAKTFQSELNVDLRSEGSTILWLWIKTKTPKKTNDFLNKLISLYKNDRLKEKNIIAIKTIDFIDEQLEGFSDSLNTVEDKLQYFKQNNNIILSDEGKNLLDQLNKYDETHKQLLIKRDYYKYMQNIMDEDPNNLLALSPAILGFDDPILETHISNLANTLYEKNIMNFSVQTNADIAPNVIKNMEVENLIKTIKQHIEQTIKYTEINIEDTETKISELKKQIYRLPIAERQLLQINRQFELNNQIYTFLLQRRMEAGITLASNTPDVSNVDFANDETVNYSGKEGGIGITKILIFALLISGAIIVFILFFKNKIEDASEIEILTDIPIISTISQNNKETQLPAIKHPKSSISETFRLLRTNIQHWYFKTAQENQGKIISISSTISGEGKSFIAANLASIFAINGKRVVLIGLDLRKPKVQEIFKTENTNGVVDYLTGTITYQQLVREYKFKNGETNQETTINVILPGTKPPNPAELIESKDMTDLLLKLQKDFHYVIIDTPPIGIVSDGLTLARQSDLFLYVVRQKVTNKNSIKLLNDLVKNNELKSIGIIFNGVKKSAIYGPKYGYGYGYGYDYGYGYGYGQGYYDDDVLYEKNFFKRINNFIIESISRIFK